MTTAIAEIDRVECFGNMYVTIPEEIRRTPSLDAELDKIYNEMNCDPKHIRTFRIMTPNDGDKRVIWNCRVIREIKAAKDMFLNLIKQGMMPFRVGVDGKRSSERMEEFDPIAEEVVFIPMPAVVGG